MATCARCGKDRKLGRALAVENLCNPCRVRVRYEAGTPAACGRCGEVRLPFSGGLCKSCYQVTRKDPAATRRGSPEWVAKRAAATPVGANRREKNGKWKGGRFVDSDGYVRVLPPEDYAGPKVHGGRYVHEHRLVAEQTIGRPLAPGELVHHVNHDRADNRPENLQVLSSVSEHRRLHVEEQRAKRRA